MRRSGGAPLAGAVGDGGQVGIVAGEVDRSWRGRELVMAAAKGGSGGAESAGGGELGRS